MIYDAGRLTNPFQSYRCNLWTSVERLAFTKSEQSFFFFLVQKGLLFFLAIWPYFQHYSKFWSFVFDFLLIQNCYAQLTAMQFVSIDVLLTRISFILLHSTPRQPRSTPPPHPQDSDRRWTLPLQFTLLPRTMTLHRLRMCQMATSGKLAAKWRLLVIGWNWFSTMQQY